MAIVGVYHGSKESVIIYLFITKGGVGGEMAGLRIW